MKIIGIIASRYKKPMIKAIEQTSSPKIANPRDRGLPIPNGSTEAEEPYFQVAYEQLPEDHLPAFLAMNNVHAMPMAAAAIRI